MQGNILPVTDLLVDRCMLSHIHTHKPVRLCAYGLKSSTNICDQYPFSMTMSLIWEDLFMVLINCLPVS